MTVKCTLLMQQLTAVSTPGAPVHRIAGWSESWYYPGNSIAAAIQAVTGGQLNWLLSPPVATTRASLLCLGGTVVGARFQVINPVGQSVSIPLNLPGFGETDVPSIALLCAAPALGGLKNIRRFTLRGVTDVLVTEGEFQPIGTISTLYNNFFRSLAGFQFQARDLSQPLQPMLTLTALGTVGLQNAAININVGNMVRILKTRDASGNLRGGRFQVLTVGLSSVGLLNWPFGACTGGNLRVDPGPIYPAVDALNITISRVTVRKVGRPFVQYRGRRSRRR